MWGNYRTTEYESCTPSYLEAVHTHSVRRHKVGAGCPTPHILRAVPTPQIVGNTSVVKPLGFCDTPN